jgi:OmpA-OmpF porin, OOP family
MKKVNLILLCYIFCTSFVFAQNEDAEGCKDHPMFNRMPNYHITSCEFREFDAHKFTIENSTEDVAKKETIEGKYFYYTYHLDEGSPEVSDLQVFRNFETALKKINAAIVGKVVEPGNSYSFICAKVSNGNNEIWIRIEAGSPEYFLTIVEREVMIQVIQANDMLAALNTDGYIALDILFDTGKSTIKPESRAIVEEIYTLLKNNTTLKISIEGHTDNVGIAPDNKKLSEARSKAVMDVLIAKGINKERLTAVGWGQEKPVADNRTEEGRKKNRRVEIVKCSK